MVAAGLALLSCARHPREEALPPPPPVVEGSTSGAPYGRADYPDAGAPYGRADYGDAEAPPPPPPPAYGGSGYARSAPPGYAPPPSYGRPSYARSAPPGSYARPSYAQAPQVIRPPAYAPPRPAPYGRSTYAGAEPPPQGNSMVWRSSPRWATTKKKPVTKTVKAPQPDPQAKFKAAQAKAAEVGVENLTQADIAGLSVDEIKLLRGY
jgi:hypothetical protein